MVLEQLKLTISTKLRESIEKEAKRYELNAQNWIKMVIATELKKKDHTQDHSSKEE